MFAVLSRVVCRAFMGGAEPRVKCLTLPVWGPGREEGRGDELGGRSGLKILQTESQTPQQSSAMHKREGWESWRERSCTLPV